MAALKSTSTGRCGLKLQLAWQRMDAHLAPCIGLELVCGVPDLQGADTYIRWEVGASAAGTRGAPRAALGREVGAGAVGTRGAPGAALRWEVGAGATGTHGAPEAALCQEVGAGATGTRGTLELP
jgi:hypothetical protein